MKHFFNLLCFLALTSFFISCGGNDNDVTPNSELSDVQLSLAEESTPIQAPSAMTESDDEKALMATRYIDMANGVSKYLVDFEPPEGATKSSTPITTSNGRVAQTQGEYLVYTWSSGTVTIAYQVSQTADSYVFEVFYKFKDDAEFVKYVHAEESKTIRKGFMSVYNIQDGSGNEVVVTYHWEEKADGTFLFDFEMPGFSIKLVVNPDQSGSLQYITGTELFYEIIWDAEGNGTWTYYAPDPDETGSWTVS